MKWINPDHIPEPLFLLLQEDLYERGDIDYSVTQLQKPPRLDRLMQLHGDEIEINASENIAKLDGQVIHYLLEKTAANVPDAIVEARYIANINGLRIGAKIDYFNEGILTDYKRCKVSETRYQEGPKQEWVEQLNIQAELMRQNGITPKKLQICAILKDWVVMRVGKEDKYPLKPVLIYEVPMWEPMTCLQWICERIDSFELAKTALPDCTADERWAKNDVYAVKRHGKKDALRGGLFANYEQAADFVSQNPGTYIEVRAAESTRCQYYCPVRSVCSQWTEIKNQMLVSSKERELVNAQV